MNTHEFCNFAADKIVADFLECEIISEADASDVHSVIVGALQAASQHAAVYLRDKVTAAVNEDDGLELDSGVTANELIEFIQTGNHPHA